jgi:hypothetical protein
MENNDKPEQEESKFEFHSNEPQEWETKPESESEESQPEPQRQSIEPTPTVVPLPTTPGHVLPPKPYKLKTLLMFSDLVAIVIYIYLLIIINIARQISADTFSLISNQMFAYYCVFAITIGLVVLAFICKSTKSARTRFQRDNELRQDENIKVWLTGFDWGWPVLFVPTMTLMAAAGIIGIILNAIARDSSAIITTQHIIGGIVITFGALNTAVVIFKLKPVTLGLILGSIFIILLILLLHGPKTFVGFFRYFKYMGVTADPAGYLLLAYIWSIFLRIIWLKSLFFYWVFLPNRLELQHGLSESNDSVDRSDLRHQIDTDDVILRWWNVGIVTFYFPQLDRLPITNVVLGIRKKALYANRIASVITMQD